MIFWPDRQLQDTVSEIKGVGGGEYVSLLAGKK